MNLLDTSFVQTLCKQFPIVGHVHCLQLDTVFHSTEITIFVVFIHTYFLKTNSYIYITVSLKGITNSKAFDAYIAKLPHRRIKPSLLTLAGYDRFYIPK